MREEPVVGVPAWVGIVAPTDIVVPPGSTGFYTSQTNFFQLLNIPTRISKGSVEIVTPVELIKKGDKKASSEAFSALQTRDKAICVSMIVGQSSVQRYSISLIAAGVCTVAFLLLSIKCPTLAAPPLMFINAYKNLLAVAVETQYSYPLAQFVKELWCCSSTAIADEEDIELSDDDDEMLHDIFT
ncbi:60S ribosomal protein L10P, insertion domain [Dillenia turbinata]|uniref:60S ribosomal protein L10P, insertion domain n=1 Tax=Dillenia turbinata TaxID=194707 RepID=A0AAN8VYF5_9MAGN